MKQISLFIPLLGTLLLSGCAGTNTEFECNATTSDTCMTMEQANEKAKKLEQSSEAKPVAASLPRLAEGNFRTMPVQTVTATTPSGSRPEIPEFTVRTQKITDMGQRNGTGQTSRIYCQHRR